MCFFRIWFIVSKFSKLFPLTKALLNQGIVFQKYAPFPPTVCRALTKKSLHVISTCNDIIRLFILTLLYLLPQFVCVVQLANVPLARALLLPALLRPATLLLLNIYDNLFVQ